MSVAALLNLINKLAEFDHETGGNVSALLSNLVNRVDGLERTINSSVTRIETDINTLSQLTSTLNNSVGSLSARVDALENSDSITAITSRVEQLETTVNGLSSKTAWLDEQYSATADTSLQALETARESQATATSANAKIDALTERVSTENSSINAQITDLSQHWTELGSRVTVLENKVADLTSGSTSSSNEINQLNNRITSLSSSVTNITNNVSSLSSSVSNITNDVGSLSSSHSTTQSNVSLLQTKVTNLVNVCNTLKTLPVVTYSQSFVLGSNGYAKLTLSDAFTNYTPYLAPNDSIISVVPYDIRFSSSKDEYATISTSWADFENDSKANFRLTTLSGSLPPSPSGRFFYLANNPARNAVI